jgi:hypothetical protein
VRGLGEATAYPHTGNTFITGLMSSSTLWSPYLEHRSVLFHVVKSLWELYSIFTEGLIYQNRANVLIPLTGLQAGRPRSRGSICGSGKRFLSSPNQPEWLWSPAVHLHNGYRERGSKTSSLAEVKNECSCTYTPWYALVTYTGTTLPLKNVTLSILTRVFDKFLGCIIN